MGWRVFLRYLFSWIGAGLASIGDSHAALAFGIGLFVASAACVTVTIAEGMRAKPGPTRTGLAWDRLARLCRRLGPGKRADADSAWNQ